MDFIDEIKQFSKRVESLKQNITTEEATKTALIMPFFALLGYDVFNPHEFVPEFVADVGIKKGEKVDYAIMMEDKPSILIEAKWIGEALEKHDSQLFRYFGTTAAKFAILTNGQIYRFYTDLEQPNKMDEKPFLEIDLLNLKEAQIPELKKFCKANFDLNKIMDSASELKYSYEFKRILATELQEPSDALVRHFLTDAYDGMKTQNVVERFRPVLKKAMNDYISELMNDRIKTALGNSNETVSPVSETADEPSKEDAAAPVSKVVTTEEELEAYFIVKNLLHGLVEMTEITYKDTESYFNVLYKNNTRKWICRFRLSKSSKFLILPDENKKEVRYRIESVYDIYNYKQQLEEVLNRYL